MKYTKILILSLFVLLLTACESDNGMSSYSENRVGSVHKVVRGKILSTRQVKLEDSNGVFLKDEMGNDLRKNYANKIRFTGDVGFEYIIETVKGDIISYVDAGDAGFKRGDRVLVIYGPRAHVVADPYQA